MFRYYIFCICLLQLATIVSSYTLLNRAQHTASYVDNKIYFIGGSTYDERFEKFTNDFFYLNVLASFSLNADLPIVDQNNEAPLYSHEMATSTVCKDTIYLHGGKFEDSTAPLVFAFNTRNPTVWFNVNADENGFKPIRRSLSTGVCDKNAKIYSFGGNTTSTTDNNKTTTTYSNDLYILDTNQLTWSLGSNLNGPPPMDATTATLLPDGRIVYIGGYTSSQKLVNISEIYIYDTNNGTWSNMTTNGDFPAARASHTAVLTKDGRIIVYGGILEDGSTPAPNPLLVLDTTVQPFEWSIPTNFNDTPYAPIKRHTATLVENYMIVAFGFYDRKNLSNQIHILDVSDKDNYKWVTKFTPSYLTRLKIIIGGTIGSIIIVVVGISIIFLLYRRNCRNKEIISLYQPGIDHL